MPSSSRKTIFTTISIDKETAALVEKICKRYSLKKSEVVKLAFGYIDKAHINPSEAPESVKSELAKINKRQDDIIRFIRHYEDEQLNPMIRATNSIALRFDAIGKTLETLILSQLEANQERQTAVLKKLSEQFCNHADVINNQSKQINALNQYAKNFNKELLAEDIKFYGKIHFSRGRSNNKLNMHCHLIVSRKDQSNKKKISPFTNHKNTKKGTVKGSFDRKNLFQQAEQGFDKLFGYQRQLTESFEYYNTMKNGSISKQLNMQEWQIASTEIQPANQLNVRTDIQPDRPMLQQSGDKHPHINMPDLGLSSIFGLITPDVNKEEEYIPIKKKKTKRGFRR